MNIGEAVGMMWSGNKVARAGWNGKNMHIAIQMPDQHSKMTQPYVYIHTVQGDRIPWLCSQADLLAIDWEVVGIEKSVTNSSNTSYGNIVPEEKKKRFVAGVQVDIEGNKSF